MDTLASLSAAIENNLADLDRREGELMHENTDVTDVMNFIAGIRQRARLASIKALDLAAAR